MAKTAPQEIDLLGSTIAYDVRRSPDASEPRIDVDIHGVAVILPEASDRTAVAVLKENAAWVVEKHQKYERYREQIPDRCFEPGATFPYLDEPHEIVVEQRPKSSVENETLRLAAHHVQQTSIKRALESLYRRKARERFEDRATTFANGMGVEFEQIEVRNQRTKWGSCSTSGTLGLNWRLMMAPPDVIDYIITHELAHLREPNHTDAFWDLVASHDPDYQAHAAWLDEHSTRLIFSEDDL